MKDALAMKIGRPSAWMIVAGVVAALIALWLGVHDYANERTAETITVQEVYVKR